MSEATERQGHPGRAQTPGDGRDGGWLTAPIRHEVPGEGGVSVEGRPEGPRASLTSCSESVPDSFLSLPLLPIPPFFRLLLPGFRPLWEGPIRRPDPPANPRPPPTPGGPWPATPGHWGPGSPPAGALVPVQVVVFPIPLHVRHRSHQVLQEIKLLLQLNALLPGRGGRGGHGRARLSGLPARGRETPGRFIQGWSRGNLRLQHPHPTPRPHPCAVTPTFSPVQTHSLREAFFAGLPGASHLQPLGQGPGRVGPLGKGCHLLGQNPTGPFQLLGHSQVGRGHGLGVPGLSHLAGLLQKRLQEQLQRPGSGGVKENAGGGGGVLGPRPPPRSPRPPATPGSPPAGYR